MWITLLIIGLCAGFARLLPVYGMQSVEGFAVAEEQEEQTTNTNATTTSTTSTTTTETPEEEEDQTQQPSTTANTTANNTTQEQPATNANNSTQEPATSANTTANNTTATTTNQEGGANNAVKLLNNVSKTLENSEKIMNNASAITNTAETVVAPNNGVDTSLNTGNTVSNSLNNMNTLKNNATTDIGDVMNNLNSTNTAMNTNMNTNTTEENVLKGINNALPEQTVMSEQTGDMPMVIPTNSNNAPIITAMNNIHNPQNSNTVRTPKSKEMKQDYKKAMAQPHEPSIAQYGTKGISNIFSPKIVIKNKKQDAPSRGSMSYNSYRDSDEIKHREFPDMRFEAGPHKGRIVPRRKQEPKDWQEPTHDLWKESDMYGDYLSNKANGEPFAYYSENDNNVIDSYMMPNMQKKSRTDWYKGEDVISPDVYGRVYGPMMYDIENDILSTVDGGRIDSGVEIKIREIMGKKNSLNNEYFNNMNSLIENDPLNTTQENMANEKAFKSKQDDPKDCKPYTEVHARADVEKLVKEAIEKNTWKKFSANGYSVMNPNGWDVPKKHPPVCIPDRAKLPSAVFTEGTPVNVLEFDKYGQMAITEEDVKQTNVGSMLPKFKYEEIRN